MTALRRQGFTFKEIGTRIGCSDRTARRYAGRVQPQLRLPGAEENVEADPRALREHILSELIGWLYRDDRLRSVTMTWHRVDDSTDRAEYGGRRRSCS